MESSKKVNGCRNVFSLFHKPKLASSKYMNMLIVTNIPCMYNKREHIANKKSKGTSKRESIDSIHF